VRFLSFPILALLIIEFLDEFVFGAREAAWPLIREDLSLSYVQIGLLLSLPGIFSSFVEPVLGILADVWRRRVLILGGGVVLGLALLLTAISHSFFPLLISFIFVYPASGAFVSLSQAALMDSDPSRHEQNMARWTFAGSLGVVGGPLILSGALALGVSWRGLFVGFAAFAFVLVASVWRSPMLENGVNHDTDEEPLTFKDGLRQAAKALRRREVLRWLVLLDFSDLMLDVLFGFLALYFVDVVGVSVEQAGLAVSVWAGVGLLGDFLLIPLLERVRGLPYLRVSAAVVLVLFPAFLLIQPFGLKLILIGILGLLNSGWYAILQAKVYSAMPGQSGTVLAVENITGLFTNLLPLGLGVVAEQAGLNVTMWLLLAGPVALLIGIPRRNGST
jgi:FSR family fosmidomycin resistance protein-like MFS transporter